MVGRILLLGALALAAWPSFAENNGGSAPRSSAPAINVAIVPTPDGKPQSDPTRATTDVTHLPTTDVNEEAIIRVVLERVKQNVATNPRLKVELLCGIGQGLSQGACVELKRRIEAETRAKVTIDVVNLPPTAKEPEATKPKPQPGYVEQLAQRYFESLSPPPDPKKEKSKSSDLPSNGSDWKGTFSLLRTVSSGVTVGLTVAWSKGAPIEAALGIGSIAALWSGGMQWFNTPYLNWLAHREWSATNAPRDGRPEQFRGERAALREKIEELRNARRLVMVRATMDRLSQPATPPEALRHPELEAVEKQIKDLLALKNTRPLSRDERARLNSLYTRRTGLEVDAALKGDTAPLGRALDRDLALGEDQIREMNDIDEQIKQTEAELNAISERAGFVTRWAKKALSTSIYGLLLTGGFFAAGLNHQVPLSELGGRLLFMVGESLYNQTAWQALNQKRTQDAIEREKKENYVHEKWPDKNTLRLQRESRRHIYKRWSQVGSLLLAMINVTSNALNIGGVPGFDLDVFNLHLHVGAGTALSAVVGTIGNALAIREFWFKKPANPDEPVCEVNLGALGAKTATK